MCCAGTALLCAVVLGRVVLCLMVGSLCGHVICVCALKASKEAGQALVCKTNPNFEVHHHHLLHCLEKTTVRTQSTYKDTVISVVIFKVITRDVSSVFNCPSSF